MLTKIRYGSEEEYSQLLLTSKNEKKAKQKKRYDTVLIYMEGYERKQISEILHIPIGLSAPISPAIRKGEWTPSF